MLYNYSMIDEFNQRFDKTIKSSVKQLIKSKNPVLNEIIRPGAMDAGKLYKLNRNKKYKASGWLSDSRNK